MLTQALVLAILALGASCSHHLQAAPAATRKSLFTQSPSSSKVPSAHAAETTMNLFVLTGDQGDGWVGSIIDADSCETTIGVACTSGSFSAAGGYALPCNPDATGSYIYGPGRYEASTAVSTAGTSLSISQSCSLSGTTRAVCDMAVRVSEDGMKTSTTITTTLSGSDVVFAQIPITAGASKLSNLGGCTATSAGIAPAATKINEIYKVLTPGAALLAGVLV